MAQLREQRRLRRERKARYLYFASCPLQSFSFQEVCSLDYEDLLTLAHFNPPLPEDWESLTQDNLLVHVLYLRVLEGELEAAAAVATEKVSGGEDIPLKAKLPRLTAWNSDPAESFFHKDFCPPNSTVHVFYGASPTTSISILDWTLDLAGHLLLRTGSSSLVLIVGCLVLHQHQKFTGENSLVKFGPI